MAGNIELVYCNALLVELLENGVRKHAVSTVFLARPRRLLPGQPAAICVHKARGSRVVAINNNIRTEKLDTGPKSVKY